MAPINNLWILAGEMNPGHTLDCHGLPRHIQLFIWHLELSSFPLCLSSVCSIVTPLLRLSDHPAGIEDATKIAARFIASAIISRIIISYEVAGMRSAQKHSQNCTDRACEAQLVPTPADTASSDLENGNCKVSIQLSELVVNPEQKLAQQGSIEE